MEKVYTIMISDVSRKGIWYANKIGREYEARLKGYVHASGKRHIATVVFEVNPCQYVYPQDCLIVAEKSVKKYKG